jgi:phosphatidylserine decarboxylase
VYRLNRRWWSLLETRHFGLAAQIEVGAMLVGGVRLAGQERAFRKGEEMGHFELAGSTVLLLLGPEVRRRLDFFEAYSGALEGQEIRVRMGEALGRLRDD